MSYCVDWLSFTVQTYTEENEVAQRIMLELLPQNVLKDIDLSTCNCCNTSKFGYTKMLQYENKVLVLFAGSASMGIHISLPGSTLNNTSELNDLENIKEWYWRCMNSKYNIHFSRVDVAKDISLPFSYFRRKVLREEYRSKYRKSSLKMILNNEFNGTIYLGRRGGNTSVRIYDKNQCNKDKNVGYISEGFLTRVEFEFRNDACLQALNSYILGTIKNVFLGHLCFVNKKEKNMSRDSVNCEKYVQALEDPKERKILEFKRLDTNTNEWFFMQVLPAMKAYENIYGKKYVQNMLSKAKPAEGTLNKLKQQEKVIQNRFKYQILNREVI